MKKITILLAFVSLLFISNANAQAVTASANFGIAKPGGEAFEYENGMKGGLVYSLDLLYYLPQMDGKLGVGLGYNASLIGGAEDPNTGIFDLDLYGLSVYGVKGQYRIFDTKVTPYVALTAGLGHLVTPEMQNEAGDVIMESIGSSSLAIVPEIGVELGFFKLSAAYVVPMKYKTFADDKESVGVLQFSLGFRIRYTN